MFKGKGTNGSFSKQKKMPPKPRPDFTTDFVDREKYKLSEAEMIQKKAALQSKNREEAILSLQERRKKLEQGIIDDDTRKVYETALTSKKIDINPTVRKNLSQMIKYQREKQDQMRSSSRERQRPTNQWTSENGNEEESEDDNNNQIERQLRDTRDFIKKFQRAKKVDNIERAVEILGEAKSETGKRAIRLSGQKERQISQKNNPLCNQKLIMNMQQSKASVVSSQEEALSSIQDTIRFMEERLFSAKRIQRIKKEEAEKLKDSTISLQGNYQPFISAQQIRTKQNLQLSGLGYHENETEEQCLQTIRRMKEMMEGQQQSSPLKLKENMEKYSNKSPRFEGFSTLQKISPHLAQSEAEVDFSLTINDSQHLSLKRSKMDAEAEERQYQRLKNSLFQEVNRLQLQTPEVSIAQPSFQVKESIQMDQSSLNNIKGTPTQPVKPKKVNSQIAKLRNQINGVRQNVQSIKVEPIGIARPSEVMGVDFRGSINIKRHIVHK